MRLILLIVLLGGLLPLTMLYPHVGLLLWGWLTVMQPHQEVWGLPEWLQLNLIVAVVTITLWLLSREPKLPRASALPFLLALLCLSMAVSQVYSLRPDYSWPHFDRHLRVMAFVLLSLVLLRSRTRVHAMVWILGVSIGYYGVLGGGFTLVTGGQYLVLGPASSMIGDNNHLGLAIVTVLPILNYLRRQSRHRIVRIGILATMALCVIAVLGTYSRGAFITLLVMGFLFLLKARARLVTLVVAGVFVLSTPVIMSQFWEYRMRSVEQFEQDASFQGRIDAWVIAYEVAKARPLVGAGMRVPYVQEAVDPYLSEPRRARAAHSIYFEFLGSMGFVGLAIFLAVLLVTWRDLRWIQRAVRGSPGLKWAADLTNMAQIGFLSFLFGGGALSMEFWEGFWLIVVFANCTRGAVQQHLEAEGRPAASATRTAPPVAPALAGGMR